MKVFVDQDKCIACGACVAINPENFDFDEIGLSKVINEEAIEKTKDAEEACPVFAIRLESDSNKENTIDEASEGATTSSLQEECTACCCEHECKGHCDDEDAQCSKNNSLENDSVNDEEEKKEDA